MDQTAPAAARLLVLSRRLAVVRTTPIARRQLDIHGEQPQAEYAYLGRSAT